MNPDVKSTRNISETRKKSLIPTRRAQSIVEKPLYNRLKNYVISCTYKSRTGERDGKTKINNQDSYIIRPFLQGTKGQYLFSICDGHGNYGHEVSKFIKDKLPGLVEANIPLSYPDIEQIRYALQVSISEVSRSLKEDSKISIETSGSTLNSIVISSEKLVCGNIGDSRAVLGNHNEN